MRCNLCNQNCQCACRGGGCKGCGQSNNQVTYTNSLLKLGMEPNLIHKELDFIHKAQKCKIQAFDVWDNLVNGKEFSEQQKEALEKNIPLRGNNSKPNSYTGFVSKGDNPVEEHSFPDKNPRSVCEYCGGVQRYRKNKPCPSFKGTNKE